MRKWHGLKDKEIIYRQRYAEMFPAMKRSTAKDPLSFSGSRDFWQRRFIEVDTPIFSI